MANAITRDGPFHFYSTIVCHYAISKNEKGEFVRVVRDVSYTVMALIGRHQSRILRKHFDVFTVTKYVKMAIFLLKNFY